MLALTLDQGSADILLPEASKRTVIECDRILRHSVAKADRCMSRFTKLTGGVDSNAFRSIPTNIDVIKT